MTFTRLALFSTCLMLLAGCDTVRDTLGFERSGPDEFDVSTAAPLSMPPDYNLRPPAPGAARPQEVSASAQAQQVLLGGKAAPGSVARGSSVASNDAFLQQVGSAPTAVTATDLPADIAATPQAPALETVLFGTPAGPADSRPDIRMKDRSSWF